MRKYLRDMKAVFLGLCFISLAYCQKDCSDPNISVKTVISTSETIFLLWEVDSTCTYTYTLWWHPDGDLEHVNHQDLEIDDSKFNITGLVPNTKYELGISSNASSINTTFTGYTAPAPVSNLTVVDTKLNSITVSWDPSVKGSGDTSPSEVCIVLHDGTSQCDVVNVPEYKFTGLGACTTYSISVTSLGFQPKPSEEPLRSVATTIKHQTLKAVPGTVRNLEHLAGGSFVFVCSWTQPVWYESPECVTYYNVSKQNHESATWYRVEKGDPSIYIVYEPCASYNISIVSVGDLGESAAVTEGQINTAPESIPYGGIYINKSTTSWVEVSWDEPLSGSECMTSYSIYGTLSEGNATFVPLKNVSKYERSYNFTDFEPCETRKIQIYTVNKEGIRSDERTKSVYSKGEDPGNFTSFLIYGDDYYPYETNLWWSFPYNVTSKCRAGYEVCNYYDDTEVFPSCYFAYMNTSYTFSRLRACTKYTFTVQVLGPHGMRFQKLSQTKLLPYQTRNVMTEITVRSYKAGTLVTWSLDSAYGTDCIINFNVCYNVGSESVCDQANSTDRSAFISYEKKDIHKLTVTAKFYDFSTSNDLTYYNNGCSALQTSSVFLLSLLSLLLLENILH